MSLNHVLAVCLASMMLLTGCVTPENEAEEKDDTDLTTSNESEGNYEGDDPGECEDDADNDRDGSFDCNDSDCKGSKVCPEEIAGCTYIFADNYNPDATKSDGKCLFENFTSSLENNAYNQGYEEGINDAEGMNNQIYDEGYQEGYNTGKEVVDNAAYNNGYNDGYEDGYYSGDSESTSTLDTVIERGSLKCGVKTSQFGMGYLADDGTRSGLDIEYCRAVAAAIGLNPDEDIEYVLATGSNRFELLYYEEIDVLIRTTTWTTSRDTMLDADFAGINFYDGSAMLVNLDAHPGAESIMDLDGATVCVGIGTTTEGNLADYFAVNNMEYTAVNVADAAAGKESFTNEECSAWTGDMSAMAAQKWSLEQDAEAEFDMAIMPEIMSKEPVAAATRDNDDEWNEVVTWVWYGMLTAEELGIDSSNYGEADLSNPSLNRLLNHSLWLGTETNPLSATWMQNVLMHVGNYYEAYDRSFCDGDGTMSNCLIDRAGTANAPWWEGGLQYAPHMR